MCVNVSIIPLHLQRALYLHLLLLRVKFMVMDSDRNIINCINSYEEASIPFYASHKNYKITKPVFLWPNTT